MKTGLKYVILVRPAAGDGEIRTFSNYRLACNHISLNYNTFFGMKRRQGSDAPIEANGYIVERKTIER